MKNKVLLCCLLVSLATCALGNEVKNNAVIKNTQVTQEQIKDYKIIRDRWKEFLIGIPNDLTNSKLSKEELQQIIITNEKGAENSYSKLNLDKNRTYLFKGNENMKNGVHVMKSYEELIKIAKAYVTPGTTFYKNEKIKNQILDSLEWLYNNAYREGLPEYGNWWQWELGIPKNLNDLLTLMYEDVPSDKRIKYLKASQYFQPYAKYSGVSPSASYSSSPDKRVSTGGNRMDTSIISFLRGVLMEDKTQVLDGVNAVGDVGEYVVSGDGFYLDGSFIQHGNVPYNGTYASVLFNGLGSILWLSSGTEFQLNDKRVDNVFESILNGYSYLMINGGINDSVSGRSISRDNSNDIERGRALISSFALLTEGAPSQYKDKLESLVKTVILDNNSYNTVDKISNQTIKNILIKIMENSNITTMNIEGPKLFGAMDRAVYRNKKDGKVVTSMHSSRIANYETMNGENIQGWYTGDGMMYIYGNDSSTFTDYWPTVDMYHLPGVTNSVEFRRNGSGERRMKAFVSPKSFVGGVQTDNEMFTGMDMLSWNQRTSVKKSYFVIDDAVLVVGSNLKSGDGVVHTTIDNRILNKGNIFVNGDLVTNDMDIKNPKNLAINFNENYNGENIGYKIIEAPEIVIKKTISKGNWAKIGGKAKQEIEKTYFTTYINHGKNPKNQYFSYVVLPMFSPDEVNKYDTSRFEIVKADNDAHIIKDKVSKITAINFWKDEVQKFEGIKSYSTLSVMMKNIDDEKILYVSDPAQIQKQVSIIELDGKYELVESTDPDIKVTLKGNITKIEVDLRNNGSTQKIVLKPMK